MDTNPILSDDFINSYKDRTAPWGYGGLGFVVYKRTYSRLKPDGLNEEWFETVGRCVNGAQAIGAGYTKDEAKRLYDHVFNLRCSFAGRMLWQLGTDKVKRYGANSLLNCWMTKIAEPEDFCFLFENLMLGGGVGFSVRREDVHEFPKVKRGVKITHETTKDADFIVPDSRAGWVSLVRKVFNSWFVTGESFSYSTILVRGAGEPLKGFGGTASGPLILVNGLEGINKVLHAREGKKIRSIDALDVCNLIGSIVVAGNLRRSAQISLGDPDDILFLRAKRWDFGNVPNWRAMSNNTIYADDFDHIMDEVWSGYNGNGEPYGFFNLPLSQAYGRLKDGKLKKEDNGIGTNPCVAPETLLLTREGNRIISSIEGDEVEVWNGKQWSQTRVVKTGVDQPLLKVILRNGLSLDCTAYHKWYVDMDNWIIGSDGCKDSDLIEKQTTELRPGDKVRHHNVNYTNDHHYDSLVEVEQILDLGRRADTYCVNEPLEHKAVFNGILTGQCGEITLADKECCNLAELYLNSISSQEQLTDCARLLYKTQKAVSAMPFLHEATNKVVHRNMRLGLGVTGICQSLHKVAWLDAAYEDLRRHDKEWSKQRGWPESIKLTTTKPSGCMRRDTLISTNAGLLRLDEIGNVKGDKWQPITDLKALTDKDIQSVSKFYVNGLVKTKRLITEDGNELESSCSHRYRIVSESNEYVWKQASEMRVGDRLVVKMDTHPTDVETPLSRVPERETNAQKMRMPVKLNQDIAWFLGLFYGDGSVHEKGIRISFNRKQPALINWLIDFFRDTFNLRGIVDNDHSFYVNSQQFKDWLLENGCMKGLAGDLSLPRIIRHSSKQNATAFIDGLWRADGGIHNRSGWTICTVSKEFSKQLLCLCRSVGFNVKIECAGPGGLGSQDRWIISSRFSKGESKDRYVETRLKDRRWNGLWLDSVVSIEDSECETFDIEVEKEHCYLANSTISHNTLSLLAGATPGVHPGYSPYYIRRVRMGSTDKLVNVCREHGYHVEYVVGFDGTEDHNTVVVEFPCQSGSDAIVAKDMTAIRQLELVKQIQSVWSDNAVSVTVYYRKEELSAIKDWLREHYKTSIKSVSFLLHSDHGFRQAPYQEIDKETYETLMKQVTPFSGVSVGGEVLDMSECANGSCPIR